MAYEHYFGEGGMTSISVYARSIDDVTVDVLFERNGIWIVSPVNADPARTHGLTQETKFPFRDLRKSAADIEFHGNLTRNWSQLDSIPGPRNRLAAQTPFSGSIGTTWRPNGALSFGADYSYEGSNRSRVSAQRETGSWPTRTLDAYAHWKLDDASKLTLSVSNALHQAQGAYSNYADATGSSSRLYSNDTSTGVKLLYEKKF